MSCHPRSRIRPPPLTQTRFANQALLRPLLPGLSEGNAFYVETHAPRRRLFVPALKAILPHVGPIIRAQ